jgi:F-type H+-transporting ATPase subunit delta
MKISPAAKRYAIALLELAVEKNTLEIVKKDLELIKETLKNNRELMVLTQSPVVKSEDKKEILRKIFASRISEQTMNFIEVLSGNKREKLLLDTTLVFDELYKKFNNIIAASITSATALSAKSREAIIAAIKASTNSQIELKESIDSDLIGGFVLQIEDKLLDASISGKLKEIKYALN